MIEYSDEKNPHRINPSEWDNMGWLSRDLVMARFNEWEACYRAALRDVKQCQCKPKPPKGCDE